MTRVLLIEDDEKIAADIAAAISEAGFSVLHEQDGAAGLTIGAGGDFAAIVLDLALPSVDGMDVLKTWRGGGLRTPVLVLTARGGWMERVQGLDAGADDYLPKPFQMEELVARLRAMVRRATGEPSELQRRGDLLIDALQKRVSSNGRTVPLTPHEFRAVNYLALNCGRIVSAGELIAHVHGTDHAVTTNAMEALIGRIRRKLGAQVIETRRGFGYIIPDGQM